MSVEQNPMSVNPPPMAMSLNQPVAAPPSVQSPVTAVPEPTPKQSSPTALFAVLGIFIVAALAAGAFFIASAINVPVKVKENAEMLQPVFDEYAKNVNKIIDDIKDESAGSDADSFERAAKKSETLAKTAESAGKSLTSVVAGLSMKEMSAYKLKIGEYISKGNELIAYEKAMAQWGLGMVDPLKQYETMVLKISGMNNLMMSNPDLYVKSIGDLIVQEEAIIKQMEKVAVSSDFEAEHRAIVNNLKVEVDFIKKMKTGVENRSVAEITAAEQTYTQERQNGSKSLNRASDALKEKTKEMSSDTQTAQEAVKDEYSRLKLTYKF